MAWLSHDVHVGSARCSGAEAWVKGCATQGPTRGWCLAAVRASHTAAMSALASERRNGVVGPSQSISMPDAKGCIGRPPAVVPMLGNVTGPKQTHQSARGDASEHTHANTERYSQGIRRKEGCRLGKPAPLVGGRPHCPNTGMEQPHTLSQHHFPSACPGRTNTAQSRLGSVAAELARAMQRWQPAGKPQKTT